MASKSRYPELSETERFPILTARGRSLLNRMRQHPNAPHWNWPNGEQLDEAGLARVHAFASELQRPREYSQQELPAWLGPFVDRCLETVPFYRKRYKAGTAFASVQTTRRSDLAPKVWEFVPDDEPLDQLVVFSSSGTTGYPTRTAHHPYTAACGIPLIEHAMRSMHGIEFIREPDRVALTNVAAYRGAYTTAIVVAYLQEAGCIRVNLDASAWRDPEDCSRFINAWQAPIWLGDPIAYGSLERTATDHAPQAIVSSIMHLSDAYADRLSSRYGCPVLDLYAMTEAGIIAVKTKHGHRIVPHDLWVEILDEHDQACPMGVRGEIVLTGGRNPFLPLLRYRTGDFASMAEIDGQQVLVGFEGRAPIEYRTKRGIVIHSMEINRVMRTYPVLRYETRQSNDHRFELLYQGDVDTRSLQSELDALFGEQVLLRQQPERRV
jgi:phenylacetate-CoA ligase